MSATNINLACCMIERVERQCPFNANLRAAGQNRGYIYDFNVVENGVIRATFRAIAHKRGYDLVDSGRMGITAEDGLRSCVIVDTQADFIPTLEKCAHRIPTAEQVAARIAAEAKAEQAKIAAQAEAHRIWKIEKAGPDLLAALHDIIAENPNPTLPYGFRVNEIARAAIAKATP